MACGDITSKYLPACGLTTVRFTKSAAPPDGSLILPGSVITYTFIIESIAVGPPGITFEDIFTDCAYISNLAVTPGWTITPDGGNPCRFVIDNPLAANPGIHVVTLTATAGNALPIPQGFGHLINTANVLVPDPTPGNTIDLLFAPLLVGSYGDDAPGIDKSLGATVNFQYIIASGTAPFVVSLYLGELPTGLTISPTGLLSGVLTAAGTFFYTLQLLDANGNTYLLSDGCNVVSLFTVVSDEDEGIEALGMTLTTINMV